jgi:hypothetical protein
MAGKLDGRTDEGAVGFVRDVFEQAKPVGVICHGPWTLVEEFCEGEHEAEARSVGAAGS